MRILRFNFLLVALLSFSFCPAWASDVSFVTTVTIDPGRSSAYVIRTTFSAKVKGVTATLVPVSKNLDPFSISLEPIPGGVNVFRGSAIRRSGWGNLAKVIINAVVVETSDSVVSDGEFERIVLTGRDKPSLRSKDRDKVDLLLQALFNNLLEEPEVKVLVAGDPFFGSGPIALPTLTPASEPLRPYGTFIINGVESFSVHVTLSSELASDESLKNLGVVVGGRVGRNIAAFIPIDILGAVAGLSEVEFIKISYGYAKHLDVNALEAKFDLAQTPVNLKGDGVIVSVIDSGIDTGHRDFHGSVGPPDTRAIRFFDQLGLPGNNEDLVDVPALGAAFLSPSINAQNPLIPLDISGHGSHVFGISTGNGNQNVQDAADVSLIGVAPNADLIPVAFPFDGSFLNSALDYLDRVSLTEGKPSVVNMSFGSQISPHLGCGDTTPFMNSFAKNGQILVASIGNDAGNNFHISGVAGGAGSEMVPALFSSGSTPLMSNYHFSNSQGPVTVQLLWRDLPAGPTRSVPLVLPGATQSITIPGGNGPLSFANVEIINGSGTSWSTQCPADSSFITIRIDQAGASPLNSVVFLPVFSGANVDIDGWVSLQDMGTFLTSSQYSCGFCTFEPDKDNTISTPGEENAVVAVASYTGRNSWTDVDNNFVPTGVLLGEISSFSNVGPRLDGVPKPEIAAPGELIAAALSADTTPPPPNFLILEVKALSGIKTHQLMQGTSMAAPVVAGAVALALDGEYQAFGRDPLKRSLLSDFTGIRNLIQRTARRDSFTSVGGPNRFGAGKLDVFRIAKNSPIHWGQSGGNNQNSGWIPVKGPDFASTTQIPHDTGLFGGFRSNIVVDQDNFSYVGVADTLFSFDENMGLQTARMYPGRAIAGLALDARRVNPALPGRKAVLYVTFLVIGPNAILAAVDTGGSPLPIPLFGSRFSPNEVNLPFFIPISPKLNMSSDGGTLFLAGQTGAPFPFIFTDSTVVKVDTELTNPSTPALTVDTGTQRTISDPVFDLALSLDETTVYVASTTQFSGFPGPGPFVKHDPGFVAIDANTLLDITPPVPFGATGSNMVRGPVVDDRGNVYIVSSDLDNATMGGTELRIYDSTGLLVKTQIFGAGSPSRGSNLALDRDDNIYITNSFPSGPHLIKAFWTGPTGIPANTLTFTPKTLSAGDIGAAGPPIGFIPPALDAEGNLYVSLGDLSVIGPSPGRLVQIDTTTLNVKPLATLDFADIIFSPLSLSAQSKMFFRVRISGVLVQLTP